jgi:hypothetical protein
VKFSAKGAAHLEPGASAPGFRKQKTPALKARFIFRTVSINWLELTRAFSAGLTPESDSWGDAPGSIEIAPCAKQVGVRRGGRTKREQNPKSRDLEELAFAGFFDLRFPWELGFGAWDL